MDRSRILSAIEDEDRDLYGVVRRLIMFIDVEDERTYFKLKREMMEEIEALQAWVGDLQDKIERLEEPG